MSDRLQELRRQRALIEEHLRWLDAEIAASQGPNRPPAAPPPVSPTPADDPAPELSPEESAALARAQVDAADAPLRAKRGCWVVFLGAFALLGALIGLWFVLRYGLTPAAQPGP